MLLLIVVRILIALAVFQDQAPLVWTGKASTEVVPSPITEKDAPKLVSEMRRSLEELKTQTEVRRDFAKKLPTLDSMRAVANWSFAYPGKAQLLVEIAEVRAEWLEKLGRHAEAVFAAQHPLVMPEEKGRPPYDSFVWEPSNGSLAALITEIDALPRTIQLRNRFPAAGAAAQSGDPIEQTVRRAVETGDPAELKSFGTRCVPALVKVLSEMQFTERFRVSASQDPLTLLLQLDRSAACNLILSTIGKRPLEWTAQVVRCVGYVFPATQTWVADPDPYTPPRYDDALMLQVVDAIAEQRVASPSFVQVVSMLVRNDVVTPPIREFLLPCLRSGDAELQSQLRSMFDGSHVGPNKRDLYESCLDSPDPQLRRNAAKALGFYPVGPATLRAAQHADSIVRLLAGQALVTHKSKPATYGNTTDDEKLYVVPRTPEIEAALLKLARDQESQVRIELARVLLRSGEAPPEAVLEALFADENAAVRMALLENGSAEPALLARILERLAADEDPQVLNAVAAVLRNRSRANDSRFTTEFRVYLPAVAVLLANPHAAPEPNRWKDVLGAALDTPEGARIAFDGCVRGPRKADLLPLLLDVVRWTANNPGDVAVYGLLPASEVTELFALDQDKGDWDHQQRVRTAARNAIDSGAIDAGPFLALARDGQIPVRVRLHALAIAASKAGPAEGEAYLGILHGVRPEEIDPLNQETRKYLMAFLAGFRTNGWPAAALAGLAPRVLADASVPDLLALRVAYSMVDVTQEKLDATAVATCVERWGRLAPGASFEASYILQKLDPRLDARVLRIWREELLRLANRDALLDSIYNFPVDESTDLLIEAITRQDIAINPEYRQRAISLLTRRLDDLGADALLKAIAATASGELRQKCFEGLEQIRKYQDEKQSWQKRKGGEAAREQAITDLLPMLSDKEANIRGAAVRSLATLRAVEHLPKIVALLKDKDAHVREAAQKALDAINAPDPKKP